MKNIHILPTSQPSKFVKDNVRHTYYFYFDVKLKSNLTYTAQNIYITSDEEIKDGDWILELKDNSVWTIQIQTNTDLSKYKKIILTTDQDLIKDGVQAIDDEFLEWFVKNASCEKFEVEEDIIDYKNCLEFKPLFGYKIIIPSEEPKRKIDTCYNFNKEIGCVQIDCICEKEEPKQETLEEYKKH